LRYILFHNFKLILFLVQIHQTSFALELLELQFFLQSVVRIVDLSEIFR